jgi:hypothetical protein
MTFVEMNSHHLWVTAILSVCVLSLVVLIRGKENLSLSWWGLKLEWHSEKQNAKTKRSLHKSVK